MALFSLFCCSPSSYFSFLLFFSYFLFSGVHKIRYYHGYFLGVISLRVIRDGIPQLVGTVSLTDRYVTAAAVRTISHQCLLVSHRDAFLLLQPVFVTTVVQARASGKRASVSEHQYYPTTARWFRSLVSHWQGGAPINFALVSFYRDAHFFA